MTNIKQPKSWHDVLAVHPAADLYPMMTAAELKALGEDIKVTGLTSAVVLWRDNVEAEAVLLDGRSRLDAIEAAIGRPVHIDDEEIWIGNGLDVRWRDSGVTIVGPPFDPYTYVVSANIHRRHLTAEQKRDLIAKVLKAQPEKSNREIARQVKDDHHKVGAVRRKLEATGEVSPVEKTTGKDGKARKMPTTRHKPPTITKPKDPAIAAAVERAVARSEESQRTQALISASAADACATQDPVNAIARFVVIEIIEKEAKRLSGEQRTEFLRYLRDEIDGLLHDTNAAVECVP
jgi:hypothetical protein